MDRMIFTRSDFYQHIFEPYNKAVKNGKYVKIEYKLWRTLRDWCCDDQWYNFEIVVDPIGGGYNFYLRDDLRITPEIITMARTAKKDFSKYLEDKIGDYRQFDLEFQKKFSEQLTSIRISGDCYDTKISSIYLDDCFAIGSDCEPNTVSLKADSIYIDGKTIPEYLTEMEIFIKEKEKKEMKFGNFDFGPVDASVRMSPYGMAIKNASGNYVAYDSNSKQIMDVDIFNFEGANKFIYKMPVAIKDVAAGDVVIHARKPAFVIEVLDNMRLRALDIFDGEEKTIVLAKSPFNFDFITKVVSFIDWSGNADKSNPFGNILPFLLLGDGKTDDLLPLMMMSQGTDLTKNPLMLYALMGKDGKASDMLPLMLMCGGSFMPNGENAK